MNELPRIIPDVQMLLTLTPEELAEKMLILEEAKRCEFHPDNLQRRLWWHSIRKTGRRGRLQVAR